MKNKQGLTIASLIVAIIGLSVGFAAFSNTLTISSSASVNPDPSTLNVVWSSSSSSAATDSISPTKDPNNITNFTATNGSITGNDSRTLENISASFTAPGQSVTYNLYVYNAGQLQAQLTGIEFQNATHATGSETYKHCAAKTTKTVNNEEVSLTSGEMATDSLVSAACEGINISVSVGTATGVTPTTTGDKAALNYQLINKNSALEATVTITYASGSAYVDGPMEVEFGDITINATSAVDPTRVVVASSPSSPSTPVQVDDLIPSDDELTAASYDAGGYAYSFTSNGEVYYQTVGALKAVMIYYNDETYYWYCDSDTASTMSENYETTILPNKWYTMGDEVPELYTGSSPISLSDFNIEDSDIESYVTRVIDSFSNSNS